MSPSPTESVLRLIDREIWIVTAAAGNRRGGLCATWVSVASIDPERPVVVAGLAPNHFTAELVEQSGAFGLHLLRSDQADVALDFALGSGRDRDKLAGRSLRPSASRVPLLADCLAWLECRVIARHDAGDRLYLWADVVAGEKVGSGEPLRDHELIAMASDEQKQLLAQNRRDDAEFLKPLHERWRTANLFPGGSHPK